MKIKENLLKYIFILLAVFGLSMSLAEPWSLKVIVKRPYLAEHYDSLGNLAPDSLVRNGKIATIIYKSGMVDSLLSEAVTNDSGFVVFDFTQWHDGSAVDSSDVGRIDIAFPTTYEAIKIGEKTTFRKLRYESVLFKGRQFEEISIILPLLSVNLNEYTIGAGNFTYDIVIMTDTHIGEFGGGDSDFGSDGYDDYDDDPYETSVPIANMWSGVLFINEQLIAGGYPIKFIAYTGDVSSSSERSEYQRAITLLSALTPYSPSPPYDRIFYIPIMGNHDAWPYTPNEEMPSSSVIIGDYFYDAFKSQYDSLLCCFPLPQWQESPLLFTPTDVTGQTYPSHYLNFAFDYQQYRFISTDFNSREHAGPRH